MAKYSYQARNPSGAMQSGQLEAPDQSSAAQILLNRNLIPVSIEPFAEPKEASSWRQWLEPKVGLEELSIFARQMYSLTKSGIPILRAITGLAESTASKRMAATLEDVNEQLERGRNLSSAMHQHPKVFSPLFVSVVHVGENTGKLDDAFRLLSQYLEREQETRRQIKAATRYPTFVLIAIVIALIIINLYVIPAFSGMFAKLGAELPPVTRFLIAMSDLFLYQWHWLLAGVIGLVWGMKRYLNSETGRLNWDRRKLKLYALGSIFERALLSRFARSFSMMITAGVPLTHALNLVADAVDNSYVAKRILEMRRNIEKGESLTRVCISSGLFTPLVLQMINVGEETGRVDELLTDVADFYEREVEYDLRTLTAKIEPLLIAVVAVMVAVLALGIFTPMWGLMSAYRGGG
ncbi:type II secretion system F family protein [Aliiglaciecola sp. CAU 1673]|uniref:type II secretion system F family protein n=1 Tax=Aliiglaciecola sp. CAU 1673 TaxID=3032595 RepID=UPI0023DA15FA|nr:type II secretion system F family protein [Aliiglaciecola sp. CAU 1673]MDF2179137.1 type II secretion system F family protein [Aliiglaciecola sp. CAU 1673]